MTTTIMPPTPNLRSLLGFTGGYHTICREERNVAAILYHLLMQRENVDRFLDVVGSKLPRVRPEEGVFFEYVRKRPLGQAPAGFPGRSTESHPRPFEAKCGDGARGDDAGAIQRLLRDEARVEDLNRDAGPLAPP